MKERFSTYGESAAEGLWDDISSALDARKKRAVPAWIWTSVATAAAVAAGVFAFMREDHLSPVRENAVVAEVAGVEEVGEAVEVVDVAELVKEDMDDSGAGELAMGVPEPRTGARKPSAVAQEEKLAEQRAVAVGQMTEGSGTSAEEGKTDLEVTDENIPVAVTTPAPEITIDYEEDSRMIASLEDAEDHPYRSRWSLSLSGSSSAGSENETDTYGSGPAASFRRSSMARDEYMDLAVRNKPTKRNETHRISGRFGLDVDWSFAPGWSLGTGVFLSWPHSEFRNGTEDIYSLTSQNLGFVGIPLNLRYEFFKKGAFSFYAKAGGAGEKCISYDAVTTRYASAKPVSRTVLETPSLGGIQWSLSASVGAELSLLRLIPAGNARLSIFAEPSFNWYIPAKTELKSVYTERPFSPGFSAGIRITLGE